MKYKKGQKVIIENNGEGIIHHYLTVGSEATIQLEIRDGVYDVVGYRQRGIQKVLSIQRIDERSLRPINFETNHGAKYLLEADY